MQARRLAKRSILGSRVCAPSPSGDGVLLPGVVQAQKSESKACSDLGPSGMRRGMYTVMLEDGTLKEYTEDEILVTPCTTACGAQSAHAKSSAPLKATMKGTCKLEMAVTAPLLEETKNKISQKGSDKDLPASMKEVDLGILETERTAHSQDAEKEQPRSVSLLEQKRKVVSSNIDVPHVRYWAYDFLASIRSPRQAEVQRKPPTREAELFIRCFCVDAYITSQDISSQMETQLQ